MQKNLLQNLGQNKIYFYTKETIMIGGCYGLQVHSNTNNFIMFVSGFRKTTATIANRSKRLYNSSTKTKGK